MKKIIIIHLLFLLSCRSNTEQNKELRDNKDLSSVNKKNHSFFYSLQENNKLLSLQLMNSNLDIEDSSVIQHFVNVDSRYDESLKICDEINEFMSAIDDEESIDRSGHQHLEEVISDYITRVNSLIKHNENKVKILVSKVDFDEKDDSTYINSCISLKIDILMITQKLMLDYLSFYNKSEWVNGEKAPTKL